MATVVTRKLISARFIRKLHVLFPVRHLVYKYTLSLDPPYTRFRSVDYERTLTTNAFYATSSIFERELFCITVFTNTSQLCVYVNVY